MPMRQTRKPKTMLRRLIFAGRSVQAFFKMPGSRSFILLLLLFLATIVFSTIDLYLHYIDPDTGQRLDLGEAIYAVFALLVFETPLAFPTSWLTRVAFFAVPITGILVLGQGLVRLGKSIMNRDLWDRAMASTYKDHTIICGLGQVSTRVIQWILDLNEEVTVIELRQDNLLIDEVRSWGVPVMIADASRPEVLKEAGIEQAESIVPCTKDDLTNLSIALEARRLRPGIKVVLRMTNTRIAENARTGFDIRTAFSIPEIAAPAFAAAATKAPLDHAFAFGEGEERSILTITTFTLVPESTLVGYTIERLEDEFDVAVIAQHCEGKFMLHPNDDTVLYAGDRFVVSATIEALNTLASLTPPSREYEHYLKGRWKIKQREPGE